MDAERSFNIANLYYVSVMAPLFLIIIKRYVHKGKEVELHYSFIFAKPFFTRMILICIKKNVKALRVLFFFLLVEGKGANM